MEEEITYKSSKGKKLVLDTDHYFKAYEFKGKEIAIHRLKSVGWDGMLFISGKQWLTIKPHLRFIFNSQDHNYYKYIPKC